MKFLLLLFLLPVTALSAPITVGAKKFTEGIILGEILARTLAESGVKVKRQELEGSRIIWNALLAGNIDLYVEYTGTLFAELVPGAHGDSEELAKILAKEGLGISRRLGFNNTYGLGMKRETAEALGIKKISDLKRFPDLKLGFSSEFMNRTDGWAGVKRAYNLPQAMPKGMDHSIGYRALKTGDVDVVDVYTTDGEIRTFDIAVLFDDRGFFPRYDAVIVYRKDVISRAPEAQHVFTLLEGSIDQEQMRLMNAAVTVGHEKESRVAAEFINTKFGLKSKVNSLSRYERLRELTKEHLWLVGISLFLAILVGVPLGILAAKNPRFGALALQVVGVFQTIPALALLVVLIRPLNALGLNGIGETPAVVALFLYSLLPIVRNTYSGFAQLPTALKESIHSLGMTSLARIRYIEFPLALPTILTGIKTAAVINVGFATLGAIVGAGGYGQPILTGIRLDDYALILEGAVPAAVLAILVERLFSLGEKAFLPKPLRS